MRLLHRWADTQLRAENARLRDQRTAAQQVAIRMGTRLRASRAEVRALTAELAEMKEQNQ